MGKSLTFGPAACTGTQGFAVGGKAFSGATDLKRLQVMIEDARRRSAIR